MRFFFIDDSRKHTTLWYKEEEDDEKIEGHVTLRNLDFKKKKKINKN